MSLDAARTSVAIAFRICLECFTLQSTVGVDENETT